MQNTAETVSEIPKDIPEDEFIVEDNNIVKNETGNEEADFSSGDSESFDAENSETEIQEFDAPVAYEQEFDCKYVRYSSRSISRRVCRCTVCKKKFKKTYGKKLSATIKLNIYSIVLQKKQSTSKVKVSMANGDTIKTWISSNKKVVTVDKKGVIKAQKKGNAKITVTLKSGKKATVKVKVQDSKVKTTKLNNLKSAILIKKGKTSKIQPIVSPITSQEKIVFASSNKKIATVNSKRVIEAKKKGSTTITVKSGKIVKKIKVTVK